MNTSRKLTNKKYNLNSKARKIILLAKSLRSKKIKIKELKVSRRNKIFQSSRQDSYKSISMKPRQY
jgi:hypothetical protein